MEAIINKWLEDRRSDWVSAIDRRGQKASGKTQQKTYVVATDKGGKIMTPQPVGALLYGRGKTTAGGQKGAGVLQSVIRKWIDDKGISPVDITKDSLAFLIARKIHREGIKVPNKYNDGQLYEQVFTVEKFNELYAAIVAKGVLTIKEQIKKSWQ